MNDLHKSLRFFPHQSKDNGVLETASMCCSRTRGRTNGNFKPRYKASGSRELGSGLRWFGELALESMLIVSVTQHKIAFILQISFPWILRCARLELERREDQVRGPWGRGPLFDISPATDSLWQLLLHCLIKNKKEIAIEIRYPALLVTLLSSFEPVHPLCGLVMPVSRTVPGT